MSADLSGPPVGSVLHVYFPALIDELPEGQGIRTEDTKA